MAGETTKTTSLTNIDSRIITDARLARGRQVVAMDTHQFAAATSLEAADRLIMNIKIPSNAIVTEIAMYNDDMDTHACAATLAMDFGVAAAQDYVDITSSTETSHVKDDIIDADLFVDGVTTGQAATTFWTVLTADATTWGPEDALKPIWELLGYDVDPLTYFNIQMTSATASALLGAAADMAIRVKYNVD